MMDHKGVIVKYVICDIDGTIAEPGDRLKYLKQSPKDWDSFYAASFKDEPIGPVIEILERFLVNKEEYKVVFCTGRRDSVRKITWEWLGDHVIYAESDVMLLMRPEKDHRHDTIIKPMLLEKAGITPENTLFILEDRNSMVKKWRDLGFTCLQTREGDF
jgi:hypothetical protein